MSVALFIWLGSGRAKRRRVGEKGRYLDQAAKAGLPVPTGAILTDEMLRVFLEKQVIERQGDRIIAADPTLMHNTLFYSVRLPRFDQPVAIRPAFSAGRSPFPGRLNVDMDDPVAVAAALSAYWTAADQIIDARADLLVMEMIAPEAIGTAVTRPNETHDETKVRIGSDEERARTLLRLGLWQSPTTGEPPYIRRLQMLLRGVRRTFGKGEWAIDWADDGRICYLLKVGVAPPKP